MPGLIHQLRARELTGCIPCDAIRAGLYRGIDLWASTDHGSFNASPHGAFTQSPHEARNDDEEPEESIEKVAYAVLQDNGAPDFNWSSILRIDGDITSRYPGSPGDYDFVFGTMDKQSPTSIAHFAPSFNRGASCGGTHTGGYTNIGFGFLTGTTPGATITITSFEGGTTTVIDYWPDVPQCLQAGSQYIYYDLST